MFQDVRPDVIAKGKETELHDYGADLIFPRMSGSTGSGDSSGGGGGSSSSGSSNSGSSESSSGSNTKANMEKSLRKAAEVMDSPWMTSWPIMRVGHKDEAAFAMNGISKVSSGFVMILSYLHN